MDYEVFLMSRMHEEWERKKDATEAVTRGLALTGRVITAAAAIMVTVFASFLLGEERVIKLFGLGLASAVLVDAVIIRSILVPAIMQLLGKSAWWMPEWLSKILPNLAVEPARAPSTRTASPPRASSPGDERLHLTPSATRGQCRRSSPLRRRGPASQGRREMRRGERTAVRDPSRMTEDAARRPHAA